MNKTIIIILLALLFQFNLYAQEPITVTITGDCSVVNGIYTFNGIVNGKNNYTNTVIIEGETFIAGVGFDNTKWVLYADGDLTDDGFSNIAVPVGSLPPFTGWVNTQCEEGTMVIQQTLSTNNINNFDKSTIIYPNPTSNYLTITNNDASQTSVKYAIVDLTGRIVISGTTAFNEKINIQNLSNGNYIIQLNTEVGQKISKKFSKI